MKPAISSFRSTKPQPLRNVPVHSPCMILVDQGMKKLVWGDQSLAVDKDHLLIVPARENLTFVNTPYQGRYFANIVSFSGQLPPHISAQLHSDSASAEPVTRTTAESPVVAVTPEIRYAWNTLINATEHQLDDELLVHYGYGLLLALSRETDLAPVFLTNADSTIEKVVQQFSWSPGHDWKINEVCERLSMSESSLRRRLRDQHSSFRELLLEYRLCYGLGLLQKSHLSLADVGSMSGYQSYDRFARQFAARFGLSPSAYRKNNN